MRLRRPLQCAFLFVAAVSCLAPAAQAVLIGNQLLERNYPSDGAQDVFFSNLVGMPADGTVPSVSTFYQGQSGTFNIFQLRPTGVPDQFSVVYDSGTITSDGNAGEVISLPFPNGPADVLAGDIFAHVGRGIPYSDAGGLNAANALPIFYPVPLASIPTVGSGGTLTVSATGGSSTAGDFPFRGDLVRDYAWAVNLLTGDLVPGDVDGNLVVNIDDFGIIRDNFLTGKTLEEGDLNFDGTVDFEDFLAWKTAFGGGGPNSVPEPSSAALVVVSAGLLLWRVRRPR